MPIPENPWSGAALRQVSDENDLELAGEDQMRFVGLPVDYGSEHPDM